MYEDLECVKMIDPMVKEYLDTEYMQDRCPAFDMEANAALHAQRIGQSIHIEDAIKGWYIKNKVEGLKKIKSKAWRKCQGCAYFKFYVSHM